jgi:hypothetical protein
MARGVIEQHLQEQVALVARQLQPQGRVVRVDGGHDVAHQQRLGQRPEVIPPTPDRFGSMKRSESCQRALVKSQTASSRP